MKKSVKIIIIVAAVLICGIMLFPVKDLVADGATTYYGSILGIYNIKDYDPIYDETLPKYISFELFGKELFQIEKKNNIARTEVDLGESDALSWESLQSAASAVLAEIGSWDSVKKVYDVTYCGDEISADNLDYCKELGEKSYVQCAVFKSSFLTANSAESGGFNPNSRYDDWMWYLAKTENGEWELLTWGYA